MSITAICNDCGRQYKVAEDAVGRRVKCKACGNVFAVVAANEDYVQPDLQAASNLEPAAPPPVTKAGDTPSAIGASVAQAGDFSHWLFSRVYPSTLLLLASLIAALLIARFAGDMPDLWYAALVAFPILAGVYFVIALPFLAARAFQSKGEFKVPWYAMLVVGSQLVLRLFLPIHVIVYNHKSLREAEFGPFYTKLGRLFLRTIGIAGMSIVLLLTSFAFKTIPKNPKSAVEIRLEKLQKEREKAAHPGFR